MSTVMHDMALKAQRCTKLWVSLSHDWQFANNGKWEDKRPSKAITAAWSANLKMQHLVISHSYTLAQTHRLCDYAESTPSNCNLYMNKRFNAQKWRCCKLRSTRAWYVHVHGHRSLNLARPISITFSPITIIEKHNSSSPSVLCMIYGHTRPFIDCSDKRHSRAG